eukprot:Nk52_evm1s2330 gene=Nk52_evmTU1s2330
MKLLFYVSFVLVLLSIASEWTVNAFPGLYLSDGLALSRSRRGTCPRNGKCSGPDWNPHFYYIKSTVSKHDRHNCKYTEFCYEIKADCDWCSAEFREWNRPEGSKNKENCCKDISHIDFPIPSKDCVKSHSPVGPWEFLKGEPYLKYDSSQPKNGRYYRYCITFKGDITAISSKDPSANGVRIKAGPNIQEFAGSYGHTAYAVPSPDPRQCKCDPVTTTTTTTATTTPVTTTTVPVTTTTTPVTTTTVPVTTTTTTVTTTTVPVTTTTVPVTTTTTPVTTTTTPVTTTTVPVTTTTTTVTTTTVPVTTTTTTVTTTTVPVTTTTTP